MRAFRSVALLFLAVSAAFPLAAQSPFGCNSPKDACALFDRYLTAFNNGDWDAFRITLADDVNVMFDNPARPERQDGRAAVEDSFRRVFPPPGSPPRPRPEPVRPDKLFVQDLGDVVIVSFHIRDPDGIGRRTVVLHKNAVGWRVVHIHGSSLALPPPANSTKPSP